MGLGGFTIHGLVLKNINCFLSRISRACEHNYTIPTLVKAPFKPLAVHICTHSPLTPSIPTVTYVFSKCKISQILAITTRVTSLFSKIIMQWVQVSETFRKSTQA